MVRGQDWETRFTAPVNHHKILTLPTKPIVAYDVTITVPEDSQHGGKDLASTQQKAHIFPKKETLDFFGHDYVFDGVSQLWSPYSLVPNGLSLNFTVAAL